MQVLNVGRDHPWISQVVPLRLLGGADGANSSSSAR